VSGEGKERGVSSIGDGWREPAGREGMRGGERGLMGKGGDGCFGRGGEREKGGKGGEGEGGGRGG